MWTSCKGNTAYLIGLYKGLSKKAFYIDMERNAIQHSQYSLVDDPKIKEVIDQRNGGKEFPAGEFILNERRDIAKLRMGIFDAIKRNEPTIICAACHNPVYPKRYADRSRFYFAHIEGVGSNCPYEERDPHLRTERIDAMRYNGQKEGSDHIRMKELLVASIAADAGFDAEKTAIERNWYGITDQKKWRRPDVAAARKLDNGHVLRVAFEVQLSSAYLKVMAARRDFYLQENALLFWIFKEASLDDPRQYQDDLFYNNNSNLFVVDDETLLLSQEKGKFVLRCHYLEPISTICEEWRTRMVTFDELTVVLDKHQVYWFDYEGVKAKLKEEAMLEKERIEANEARQQFAEYWKLGHEIGFDNLKWEYEQLRASLKKHGVMMPEKYDRHLSQFSILVLSAKECKGVATGHSTILEVANNAFNYCKPLLWYFGKVIEHYGYWPTIMRQEREAEEKKKWKGKSHLSWERKREIIKEGMKRKDPEYEQNRSYDQLFYFLFPEIK